VHRFLEWLRLARSAPPDQAIDAYEAALGFYAGDLLNCAIWSCLALRTGFSAAHGSSWLRMPMTRRRPSRSALQFCNAMMERYPSRLNPTALWFWGAQVLFPAAVST
jgi:hypothetical protein